MVSVFVFFFKQKTAYEIVSRDWSSDVCSSDLVENCINIIIEMFYHNSNVKFYAVNQCHPPTFHFNFSTTNAKVSLICNVECIPLLSKIAWKKQTPIDIRLMCEFREWCKTFFQLFWKGVLTVTPFISCLNELLWHIRVPTVSIHMYYLLKKKHTHHWVAGLDASCRKEAAAFILPVHVWL